MTKEQVKEILMLYRPGTADADDPSFAEALEICKHDAELRTWFAEHCALYSALRAKFKEIAVPEGLKEQIIAERKVHTTPMWQRAVIAAGVVAVVVMAVVELRPSLPSEPTGFASYRNYMVGYAARSYGMELNTNDLNQIRAYFSQKSAIADYVLPDNLQKNAKVAGCVAMTWQGKEVSMICFRTDRIAANNKPDLWLFITDHAMAKDTPTSSAPKFETTDEGVVTASWTEGNRTYVLATEGDKQLLGKFL